MPQYSSGGLSPAQTGFTPVRAIDKSGRDAITAQALSDVVQGVSVFGKSSAIAKGTAIAEEQEGFDTPLEDVNKRSLEIDAKINEALGTEKDKIQGPITSQRVQEVKDNALRSLTMTDRDIQAQLDMGNISSIYATSLRRINLKKRINEGSNWLFKDELINAAYNVTGGARGAAAAVMFPQTAEEQQAALNQQKNMEAVAKYEAKVTEYQSENPNLSREDVKGEINAQAYRAKQVSDLQNKSVLTSAETAQYTSGLKDFNSTNLWADMGKVKLPNGTLDINGVLAMKTKTAQYAQAMQAQVTKIPNLTTADRESHRKDIESWETSSNSLVDSYSSSAYNKELLAGIDTASKIFGIAAMPSFSILPSEVQKMLLTVPPSSWPKWTEERFGKEGTVKVDYFAKQLDQMTKFYIPGKGMVTDYSAPATALFTSTEGIKAVEEDSKVIPESSWKGLYRNVSGDTMSKVGFTGFASAANRAKEDSPLRKRTVDMFQAMRSNLAHEADMYQVGLPRVKQTPKNAPTTGLGMVRQVLGSKETNVIVDIPDIMHQDQRVVDTVVESFKAFEKHRYLWSGQYDNAVDGFNAFMEGKLELHIPSKEEKKRDEAVINAGINQISQKKNDTVNEPVSSETEPVSPKTEPVSSKERLMNFENPHKKGFDGKVWKPHISAEGGTDTLGYGHKITEDEVGTGMIRIGTKYVPIDKGLTDTQINQLFEQDWNKAHKDTNRIIDKFDLKEAPAKVKDILHEMIYQMGYLGVREFDDTLKSIKAGKYKEAAQRLMKSKWATTDSPKRAKILIKELENMS